METEDQALTGGFSPQQLALQVTAPTQHYLLETAKWAKFLAIVGFVFIGFMIIGAFSFGTFMNAMMSGVPGVTSNMPGNSGIFFTVYILLLALIYFFPSWYLFQFATKTKTAVLSGEEINLTLAISRLKSFFKFWGILLIIFIGFYIVILIGVGIGMTFFR